MGSPRLAGLSRSIAIYYRDAERMARMTALYAGLVRPGDLVFDIGAHAGDRIAAFRSLGCRVVAAEPNPFLFRFLRRLYRRDGKVSLIEAAVSDQPGRLTLHVNTANPTVSTASGAFIAAAHSGAQGWEGQHWDDRVEVEAVTLDQLVARFGLPAFTKIDVEGFEDRVLAGLAQTLPALSFEFTTLQREVALRAFDELARLGPYRCNVSLGEDHRFIFAENQTQAEIADWLTGLPAGANSGDIYAFSA